MTCPSLEQGTFCCPTTGPVEGPGKEGGRAIESQQLCNHGRDYAMV